MLCIALCGENDQMPTTVCTVLFIAWCLFLQLILFCVVGSRHLKNVSFMQSSVCFVTYSVLRYIIDRQLAPCCITDSSVGMVYTVQPSLRQSSVMIQYSVMIKHMTMTFFIPIIRFLAITNMHFCKIFNVAEICRSLKLQVWSFKWHTQWHNWVVFVGKP